MSANLENLPVAIGLDNINLHPNIQERCSKECSSYWTIALISHARKVMLKILQTRLQHHMNWESSDVQVGLEKKDEPEIKLPTFTRSKQGNSRKTITFQKNTRLLRVAWKRRSSQSILKEMNLENSLEGLLQGWKVLLTKPSVLSTMLKSLTVWIITNYGKLLKKWGYQTILPVSWETCMWVKKQQLLPCMEKLTGSKLRKEYEKAVYCQPVYLTYTKHT